MCPSLEESFHAEALAVIDEVMQPVTVTVSIPFLDVAWLPASFLNGVSLEGRCVMPADLDQSDGGDNNGYTQIDDDHDGDGYVRQDEN